MMILKILFISLLTIPVLMASWSLLSRLIDQVLKKA